MLIGKIVTYHWMFKCCIAIFKNYVCPNFVRIKSIQNRNANIALLRSNKCKLETTYTIFLTAIKITVIARFLVKIFCPEMVCPGALVFSTISLICNEFTISKVAKSSRRKHQVTNYVLVKALLTNVHNVCKRKVRRYGRVTDKRDSI